jgi:erythromycin esterase
MAAARRCIGAIAFVAIGSAALVAACSSASEPPAPGAAGPVLDLTWLQSHANAIRTPDPSSNDDFSDLEPLRQMIGNARVVALGEDSHGTHEFFAMKDRLVRFLVQRMGFTTFAMEATWAESNRVNDYVLGGPGDPHVLLSDLYFWTWNTQEVFDMIQWMHAHNANPGTSPRVNFYGFDMQSARVTMNDVDSYLRSVDAAAQATERTQYACFRQYQDSAGASSIPYGRYSTAGGPCTTGVNAVYALLAANASRFTAIGGQPAYDHALRAARIVVQNEALRCCGAASAPLRDMYMAENAEWLLDQAGPNAKIILWAHNGHINTITYAMGAFLRTRYGADYVPLGFSFNSGEYNTANVSNPLLTGPAVIRAVPVDPAPAGTYEWQFSHLGLPGFLVDLRPGKALPAADPGAWIAGPLGFRTFDELFNGDLSRNRPIPTFLPNLFDLMIFFQTSSASKLLPFKYYE